MTTNILTPIIRWSWRVADIDFRTNYFKVINKLLPIRLSEYDAKRKAKATNLPFDVAKDMVTAMVDGNKFLVRSFNVADTKYFVCTNKDFTLLVSCTCADHVQHKVPCKHVYLTQKIYQGMVISHDGEQTLPQEPVSQSIDFGPSLESTLPPSIILLLQRERTAKKEAERMAREKANERAFQEREVELEQYVAKLVDVAKGTKKKEMYTSVLSKYVGRAEAYFA